MTTHFTKRLTPVIALVTLLVAAAADLRAEEKTITLQSAITMARENNGDLKSLRAESAIIEAGKMRAGLYPNPLLELEGESGAISGNSSENRLFLGISQEFPTGGKREKRLNVAESELARYGSRMSDAERLLLLEVKTGFHELVLAQSRLDLARRSHELGSQLLQIASERLAAGDIAELEVNLARVEAARSEGRIADAEQELLPARQRLLSLMGSPAENLSAAPDPETASPDMSLAGLKTLALQKRADLQAIAAEKGKGEAELALAMAEEIPNVTAGIGVSRESKVTSLGGVEDESTDYLIGFKLSIPLPLFDRNEAGVREAGARKNSAESRELFLRQNIEREVEAAHGRLAAADRSLQIYAARILPQLNENLKLVQEAYRLGEMGIMAVIEEQRKFIEVSEGYLSARHSRNVALAKLEAAVGTDLNETIGGGK